MSDTGSNDPYDPNRPSQPAPGTPPPPPAAPQWGSNPPAAPDQPGQFGQPQYGQPQFGQPQYGQQPYGQSYSQPAGAPPPNYLVWAVLTTLLCFPPLGIPSIVYAARVNAMHAGGDIAGAQESSRKAKQFAIWSAVSVIVVYGLLAIILVAVGTMADNG